MNRVTLKRFTDEVLPALHARCSTREELEAALKDYEVVDADGKAVDTVVYDVAGTLALTPTGEPGSDQEAESAGDQPVEARSGSDIDARVKAAVDEAIAALRKERGRMIVVPHTGAAERAKRYTVPATARKHCGKLVFKDGDGATAEAKAYAFGLWCIDLMSRKMRGEPHAHAAKWLQEHGIGKAMSEGSNQLGGYLVPDEFVAELIEVKNQYGVVRQNARIYPMASDTKIIPRHTGSVTAYWPAEAGAITASDVTGDNITLVAKTLAAMVVASRELNEDAAIDLGNMLASDMSYALAYAEDRAGIRGDGSSTHGGITGIGPALAAGTLGRQYVVGDTGTGTSWASFAVAVFETAIGKLPAVALPNAKWYCSSAFFATVMDRLARAAGGTTMTEYRNGVAQASFLGYPVVRTDVMPVSPAASAQVALFGDMNQALALGDRRQMAVEISDQASVGATSLFATNQIAFKCWERLDIAVRATETTVPGGGTPTTGPMILIVSAA